MRAYALHNVVVEVEGKRVKVVIERPVVPVKGGLTSPCKAELVRDLVEAASEGYGVVRVASPESPLRLTGGYVQLEESRLILVKRDADAPTYPLCLDAPSGTLDEEWRHPLAMIAAESVEVLRRLGDRLAYPLIEGYEEVVRGEFAKVGAVLGVEELEGIGACIEPFPGSEGVEVVWMGERLRGVDVLLDLTSRSIALVGLLRVESGGYEYADGELGVDRKPLNREVYVFDFELERLEVWKGFKLRKIRPISALRAERFTPIAAVAVSSFTSFAPEGAFLRLSQLLMYKQTFIYKSSFTDLSSSGRRHE